MGVSYILLRANDVMSSPAGDGCCVGRECSRRDADEQGDVEVQDIVLVSFQLAPACVVIEQLRDWAYAADLCLNNSSSLIVIK